MNRVDEKGKYFTHRVTKASVEVEICAVQGRITGVVHPLPGQRVRDLLNTSADMFLAVSHAEVTGDDGTMMKVDFIALNKHHIYSVVPINEPPPEHAQDEYKPY